MSIIRGKERQVFLVQYEKLAQFCSVCGLIGHDFKECGTRVHEEKSKKIGPWRYADAPKKPRPEDQFGRTGGSKPEENFSQPRSATEKSLVEPEVMDTTTTPLKHAGGSVDQEKVGLGGGEQ